MDCPIRAESGKGRSAHIFNLNERAVRGRGERGRRGALPAGAGTARGVARGRRGRRLRRLHGVGAGGAGVGGRRGAGLRKIISKKMLKDLEGSEIVRNFASLFR